MQPRIKFHKLIKKEPWLLGIKQAFVIFSLSSISAALCCCISALSHTMLFYSVEPPKARTWLHLTDWVPLQTERATSLSWIKTPAGAHWIAAFCLCVSNLSAVLSSRLLNNKDFVVKVPQQVLIMMRNTMVDMMKDTMVDKMGDTRVDMMRDTMVDKMRDTVHIMVVVDIIRDIMLDMMRDIMVNIMRT